MKKKKITVPVVIKVEITVTRDGCFAYLPDYMAHTSAVTLSGLDLAVNELIFDVFEIDDEMRRCVAYQRRDVLKLPKLKTQNICEITPIDKEKVWQSEYSPAIYAT
jgi:hypothetical protein